jgi:hypothetical protein
VGHLKVISRKSGQLGGESQRATAQMSSKPQQKKSQVDLKERTIGRTSSLQFSGNIFVRAHSIFVSHSDPLAGPAGMRFQLDACTQPENRV